jgi:hypothetical protein
MRELAFISSKSAAPDAAVTAYIDMYGHDLPDNAVRAIRAATRMGNKELSRALATIAAESGEAEIDVAYSGRCSESSSNLCDPCILG